MIDRPPALRAQLEQKARELCEGFGISHEREEVDIGVGTMIGPEVTCPGCAAILKVLEEQHALGRAAGLEARLTRLETGLREKIAQEQADVDSCFICGKLSDSPEDEPCMICMEKARFIGWLKAETDLLTAARED